MDRLDIRGEMFERLLGDMDTAINSLLRTMMEKQIYTGSVSVKIGINAEPIYDEKGKRYINPRIKFQTGIGLKTSGKLDSSAPRGFYLGVNEDGEILITAEQVSVDEILRKAAE